MHLNLRKKRLNEQTIAVVVVINVVQMQQKDQPKAWHFNAHLVTHWRLNFMIPTNAHYKHRSFLMNKLHAEAASWSLTNNYWLFERIINFLIMWSTSDRWALNETADRNGENEIEIKSCLCVNFRFFHRSIMSSMVKCRD